MLIFNMLKKLLESLINLFKFNFKKDKNVDNSNKKPDKKEDKNNTPDDIYPLW